MDLRLPLSNQQSMIVLNLAVLDAAKLAGGWGEQRMHGVVAALTAPLADVIVNVIGIRWLLTLHSQGSGRRPACGENVPADAGSA